MVPKWGDRVAICDFHDDIMTWSFLLHKVSGDFVVHHTYVTHIKSLSLHFVDLFVFIEALTHTLHHIHTNNHQMEYVVLRYGMLLILMA